VQTYDEESCASPNSWLGTDAFSDAYFESVDKKCHTTSTRSVAFLCNDQEMKKFEDLPKQEAKVVEQLTISELPPPPKKVEEPEPSEVPPPTRKPEDMGWKIGGQTPKEEASLAGDRLGKSPKPYYQKSWFKALLIVSLIAAVAAGLTVWGVFGICGTLKPLGGKFLAMFRRGEPEGQITL